MSNIYSLRLLKLYLQNRFFSFKKTLSIVLIFGKFKLQNELLRQLNLLNVSYLLINNTKISSELIDDLKYIFYQFNYKLCIVYSINHKVLNTSRFAISYSDELKYLIPLTFLDEYRKNLMFSISYNPLPYDNITLQLNEHLPCYFLNCVGSYKSEGNFLNFIDMIEKDFINNYLNTKSILRL